ncbi:MAG: Maf family nucleotide pyrophosphatase [Rikenellaceae bacterium]
MLLHTELKEQGYRLFLASQSPRRQQLITDAGFEFETIKYEVDESFSNDTPSEEVPLYLAQLKSDNFPFDLGQHDIVITADTVVISRGEILVKPTSESDAREMLRRLSGEEHQVTTGVYLRSGSMQRGFSTHTKVWFRELTDDEIDYYVTHYSPLDKAGSYGIQEWIGYIGVERIEGSFYNVMGLPIQQLYCELRDMIGMISKRNV